MSDSDETAPVTKVEPDSPRARLRPSAGTSSTAPTWLRKTRQLITGEEASRETPRGAGKRPASTRRPVAEPSLSLNPFDEPGGAVPSAASAEREDGVYGEDAANERASASASQRRPLGVTPKAKRQQPLSARGRKSGRPVPRAEDDTATLTIATGRAAEPAPRQRGSGRPVPRSAKPTRPGVGLAAARQADSHAEAAEAQTAATQASAARAKPAVPRASGKNAPAARGKDSRKDTASSRASGKGQQRSGSKTSSAGKISSASKTAPAGKTASTGKSAPASTSQRNSTSKARSVSATSGTAARSKASRPGTPRPHGAPPQSQRPTVSDVPVGKHEDRSAAQSSWPWRRVMSLVVTAVTLGLGMATAVMLFIAGVITTSERLAMRDCPGECTLSSDAQAYLQYQSEVNEFLAANGNQWAARLMHDPAMWLMIIPALIFLGIGLFASRFETPQVQRIIRIVAAVAAALLAAQIFFVPSIEWATRFVY